jgi:hypothetical protein
LFRKGRPKPTQGCSAEEEEVVQEVTNSDFYSVLFGLYIELVLDVYGGYIPENTI